MKTNKLFFLFSILLSMLSTNALAYDFAVKNADGVIIYYNYINNKTEAEVTYSVAKVYNDYSGSVVIPKEVTFNKRTLKVTKIGMSAFTYCKKLTSVTIPNSVTSIGVTSFLDCISLTSVTLPNSVTTIEYGAFGNCTKLKSVNLANNVKIIDIKAFDSCYGLTSFTIPNSVTTIGNHAFFECTNLKSVTIGSGVTSIDKFTFNGCKNLQKVTSKIKKPFAIKDNNFSQETYSKATLYVPKGTVALYKKADGWKNFKNIKEEGTTTGIDDVEADNTLNTSNAIYDINGKRLSATSLDELPSGLYIINGKKVVK